MFTRGQIEWAIAQTTGRTEGLGSEPRHELKMKLKRLLDLDRKKGIDAAKPFDEFRRFAFLEGGLPGKGVAIGYTQYDAYALLLGLQLLDSNIPQMAVIRLLRRIRPELQHEHAKILRSNPRRLADSETGLDGKIKAGQLIKDPQKMAFLVLPSGAGADLPYRRTAQDGTVEPANIVRSEAKLIQIVAFLTGVSPPVLVFELVNPAHQLTWWLERAPLIRRGRP